jgi:hypothetical protein
LNMPACKTDLHFSFLCVDLTLCPGPPQKHYFCPILSCALASYPPSWAPLGVHARECGKEELDLPPQKI